MPVTEQDKAELLSVIEAAIYTQKEDCAFMEIELEHLEKFKILCQPSPVSVDNKPSEDFLRGKISAIGHTGVTAKIAESFSDGLIIGSDLHEAIYVLQDLLKTDELQDKDKNRLIIIIDAALTSRGVPEAFDTQILKKSIDRRMSSSDCAFCSGYNQAIYDIKQITNKTRK